MAVDDTRNDLLLNLDAGQQLLPGQRQLIVVLGRDEYDSVPSLLQRVCYYQLKRKKGVRNFVMGRKIGLTLCLYLFKESRAFLIRRFSSVSSLKDVTKASGTHWFTKGANSLGTSCSDMVGAPAPDCIL